MPTIRFALVLQLLISCSILAQDPSANGANNKLVLLDAINVSGTRVPPASVIRLSGLKVGDKVNDPITNAACHRITSTGLFKSIDYEYALYSDRPGVALTLKLLDEAPTLPAEIKPPEDNDVLWQALQALDPLFAPQLPATEKAIRFYETNIDRILKDKGREGEYCGSRVIGDQSGKPVRIVFEIRKYKTASKPR